MENITFTVNGETYKLHDLLRKIYAIEKSDNGEDWSEIKRFNNSVDAQTSIEEYSSAYAHVHMVVAEVTTTPKKAFWELWRSKEGKAALKAAGIFITKQDDKFVVSDTKPSRRKIIADKGYGFREYNQGLCNGDPLADYILKSKCRGEFDCLEAEGYGHLITSGDRRRDKKIQDNYDKSATPSKREQYAKL